MSITLKLGGVVVQDPEGRTRSVNVIADALISEQAQRVQEAVDDLLDNIPEDYTDLSNKADIINADIAAQRIVDSQQTRDIKLLKASAEGYLYEEEIVDDVSYSSIIPLEALPYATIDSIGGNSIRSNEGIVSANVDQINVTGKNLFNYENIGTFKNASGVLRAGVGFTVPQTAYIWTNDIAPEASSSYNINLFAISEDGTATSLGAVYSATKPSIMSPKKLTGGAQYAVMGSSINADTLRDYLSKIHIQVSIFDNILDAVGYTPYHHETIEIPAVFRNFEGYGLSAGTVYSEIDFEACKYIQRVKSASLDSFRWVQASDEFKIYSAPISGAPFETINILCDTYDTVSYSNFNERPDKSITIYSGYVQIRDSDLTTLQQFIQAIENKTLIHELALYKETDISEFIQRDFSAVQVEGRGIITFHQVSSELPVPNRESYLIKLPAPNGGAI